MNRSRFIAAAASTAMVGLAAGYGAGVAFDQDPARRIEPIQLDGPPTSLMATRPTMSPPTAGTVPVVVPPPTLGPTTAPPETVHPTVPTVTPTAPLPPPGDDGVDDGVSDDDRGDDDAGDGDD